MEQFTFEPDVELGSEVMEDIENQIADEVTKRYGKSGDDIDTYHIKITVEVKIKEE